MRAERVIIHKDWREHYQAPLLFSLVVLIVLLFTEPAGVWVKDFVIGGLFGSAFGCYQVIFAMERDRGALDEILLGMPIRPRNLIMAKFGSVYSMALFTVHVPWIFVGHAKDAMMADAWIIFLCTLFMIPSVLTRGQWVQLIPIWMLALYQLVPDWVTDLYFPNRAKYYGLMSAHPLRAAFITLAVCPVLAAASALYYEKKSLQ